MYKIKTITTDEFPFLGTKNSCSSKGEMVFVLFRKMRQKLKYVKNYSTYTPGTLHEILSGVLDRLSKLTSQTPEYMFQKMYYVHTNQDNGLCKAGIPSSNFPTMEELW